MPVYPAHVLKNWMVLDTSRNTTTRCSRQRPHIVNESDVVRGNSITIRRRNDYWAEKYRRNVGLNNFDQIQEVVVRDENLAFEMFKRGTRLHGCGSASVGSRDELRSDSDGLIQKRKVFNEYPQSLVGIGFNTRREPWTTSGATRHCASVQSRAVHREAVLQRIQAQELAFSATTRIPTIPRSPYDPSWP